MQKKIVIAAAALALLTVPVAAQQSKNAKQATNPQQQQQKAPRLFQGQGIQSGNAVYDCTGHYLGSDPDPQVRLQLLKDANWCEH